MKLTAILLCVACMQLSARSSGQTVTLKVKDAPMKEVLREIQKQTGLDIFVDNALLQRTSNVTLDVRDMPVLEVLNICLKDEPLACSIVEGRIVVQSKTENVSLMPPPVSGKITGKDGVPLIGASIKIKGTDKTTITDAGGNFSIEASNGETLEITYVGYRKKEIKVTGESVNIDLEIEVKALEDVVMIGYGQQKKGNITSAVSTVKAEEIMSQPAANVGTVLAGRVNGAIVTSGGGIPGKENPWIFIRGVNFTQQPLFVIDGVPRYGGINGGITGSALLGLNIGDLNPDEIESISILKDNAATAVYGSRGSYGVILITTKRGKVGKPSFNYTSGFNWSSPTRLPETLDAYTYALATNERLINDGSAPTYSPAQLDAIKNQTDPYVYANTDWYDVIIQNNALLQTHSLSANGGTEGIRYYVNGSYTGQRGVVDANSYKRYTLISNLSIRLAKNLSLDLQTSFRNGTTFGPGGPTIQTSPFNVALQANPISPVYNKDGSYYGTSESNNGLANIDRRGGQTKESSNYFSGNAAFNYNVPFLKGLSFKAAFNLERGYYYRNIYRSPLPIYVPDATSASGYRLTGGGTAPNLNEVWGQSNTTNIDLSAAYNKTFGQHQLDVIVLGTQNEMNGNYNTVFRDGLVRGIQSINAGSPVNQTMTGASSQAGRAGLLGRLSYQYASKYYAEFSMRADGSTKFPEDSRWGYFPAVSAGWRISKENFIARNFKFMNDLKFRISAGTTGDDNVNAFTYYYLYNAATSGNGGASAYIFGNTYAPSLVLANGSLPNEDITWAKSFMINLGMDFSFWNGKLGGSFDIYDKKLEDLLKSRAQNIPASFGIGGPILNFAKEHYWGYEVELTHTNRIGKDFTYNLRGTFTYNQGRVVDYGQDPATLDYLKAEGYSPFKTVVYQAVGIFQTQDEITKWVNQDGLGNTSLKPGDVKYADMNGDGKIDARDQLSYNNMVFPPMGFGFNTTAIYKNFNIDIFFQGSAGNKLLIAPPLFSKEYYDNRWTPENPDAKYPRLTFRTNNNPVLFPSTLNMYDGSFVRLRNLQIGYTISPDVLKRIGLRTFKVYFSGTNLLTFSKYKEFDPEVPNVTGAQSGGFYPTQKTIGFGLQLGF